MGYELRNWKILYEKYEGMQKKAIDLVSRELGRLINRDPGKYCCYILPCVRDEKAVDQNVVVIGTPAGSPFIARYVKAEEIPENGYLVKVFDNPEKPEYKIVILTGDTDREVFYAAADFVDDYFVAAAKTDECHTYPDLFLCRDYWQDHRNIPDYYKASAPKIKTRSIFTWGHPITDYRNYIENMARLKLNQLVLWNSYLPLNAADIVSYAHEFGIEVLWGYSWGWGKEKLAAEDLDAYAEEIIKEFREVYAGVPGDGFYFQSITETRNEYLNGKLIADAVSDFVNYTAGKILEEFPGTKLQFGLHTTSVKNRLEFIDRVDPRIEIVWEDCGDYPFVHHLETPYMTREETQESLSQILALRPGAPVGLYYKAQMLNEWMKWSGGEFAHNPGPFVLGMDAPEIADFDANIIAKTWKIYQMDWLLYGKKAYDMTNFILERTGGNVNIGMAGQFAGKKIWYSTALCAQMLWDPTEDYEVMKDRIARRNNVSMN